MLIEAKRIKQEEISNKTNRNKQQNKQEKQ